MHKKLITACLALVAFAAMAVVPALASASPVLTDASGTVAVGSKISATSTTTENAIFKAGSTEVKCNENKMTGTVKTNSGSLIEGTIESASFASELTSEATDCDGGELFGPTTVDIPGLVAGKSHWCIKSTKTADQWELIGANCGTASGTLTFVLTGKFLTCRYTRSTSVVGTFTTNTSPATLKVTGEPEFTGTGEGNSFLCPATGKITTMNFDLYTDTAEEPPIFVS